MPKMTIFDWLESWFEKNRKILEQNEITFSFSSLITNTDKPSQKVDINTKTQMARVSLWETGECDFEVIENENGELATFENQIIKSEKELNDWLNQCFSKLWNSASLD